MEKLRVLDLFSGIGGFAIAGKIVGGFQTIAVCEIDEWCRNYPIKNHFGAEVAIYDDIRSITARDIRSLGRIDVITAGFPCPDISCANPNGKGLDGERSGLFFELMRVIREVRPDYVVLENVSEMLRKQRGIVMGAVLYELSACGYDAEWDTIPASFIGANHLRERTWIVAYSNGDRRSRSLGTQSDHNLDGNNPTRGKKWKAVSGAPDSSFAPHFPPRLGELGNFPRADDGIPGGLDKFRRQQLKGLGNAIVPQVGAIPLQRVLELDRANPANSY